MSRTKLLLLFGGESSEHDVSIASARNVYTAINPEKFDVHLCYIDREGRWWLVDEIGAAVNTAELQELLPVLGGARLKRARSGEEISVDAILPILHGRNGEDGTVQGFAQLLHVPIVGCDVTASGIAMNKLACKQILHANDLPIIPYVAHRGYEAVPSFAEIAEQLGETLFVKPARAGSSVGVHKVRDEAEFAAALTDAHRHDQIALIEQAVTGQELEVAILGTPPNHRVSGVGEIIPGEEFYTYEDKYSVDSQAQVRVEAAIDQDTKEAVRQMASAAYEALDCRGLARVDFVRDGSGKLWILEVNTLPGFTNISMYPKLWENEGVSYTELIETLIEDALQNGTIKTAI